MTNAFQSHAGIHPQKMAMLVASQQLEVEWSDGAVTATPYAMLRRYCACAWCRREGRIGKEPMINEIGIRDVMAVGTSGLQFIFSNGHDRGFYNWEYLRAIADGTVEERFHGN